MLVKNHMHYIYGKSKKEKSFFKVNKDFLDEFYHAHLRYCLLLKPMGIEVFKKTCYTIGWEIYTEESLRIGWLIDRGLKKIHMNKIKKYYEKKMKTYSQECRYFIWLGLSWMVNYLNGLDKVTEKNKYEMMIEFNPRNTPIREILAEYPYQKPKS